MNLHETNWPLPIVKGFSICCYLAVTQPGFVICSLLKYMQMTLHTGLCCLVTCTCCCLLHMWLRHGKSFLDNVSASWKSYSIKVTYSSYLSNSEVKSYGLKVHTKCSSHRFNSCQDFSVNTTNTSRMNERKSRWITKIHKFCCLGNMLFYAKLIYLRVVAIFQLHWWNQITWLTNFSQN